MGLHGSNGTGWQSVVMKGGLTKGLKRYTCPKCQQKFMKPSMNKHRIIDGVIECPHWCNEHDKLDLDCGCWNK